MTFFSTSNFDFLPQDRIFRISRFTAVLAMVIMSDIIIASLWLGLQGGYMTNKVHLPAVLCYWVAGVVAFFSLFYFPMAVASLGPANWLMTFNPQRLAVKFRSYLHNRLDPRDIQIVVFDPSEIASIRRVEETKVSGTGQNRTVTTDYYLELQLTNALNPELEDCLKSEYARIEAMKGMKYLDHPVYLLNPATLRLHWNGISPNLDATMKMLSTVIPVLEPQSLRHDLENLVGRIKGELKEKDLAAIQEYIQKGDLFSAIKHTRTVLNLGLKEAKDFVEKIQRDKANPT